MHGQVGRTTTTSECWEHLSDQMLVLETAFDTEVQSGNTDIKILCLQHMLFRSLLLLEKEATNLLPPAGVPEESTEAFSAFAFILSSPPPECWNARPTA